MNKIVDVHGKPFATDEKVLAEDIAKAYTTGVRNPSPSSVASTLTPSKLSSLLRSVIDGDPESYMTLAEEMEERDLHYASVLRTRKLTAAAIPPTVEPASEEPFDIKLAEAVSDIINADKIPLLFFDLLDGLGKGVSVCQILWNTKSTPWEPVGYKWIDSRYLRPDQETLEEILLISDEKPQGAPLEPYKFVVHTPRSKSGSVWRNGLARLVAVMYMLKSFTVRDWWAFAEVFGIPVRVGKYGKNATQKDIETLVNALSKIASDAGAVIPESMQVELIETAKGKGGETLFENMARWCDEQTSKAVLGQTMTSDSGSSRSQAEVHDEVRMDIAKWDARQLEACINEYLVKPFIILNWGVQSRYPKVRIIVPEPEDLKLLVESITPLIDRGFKVAVSDFRDKFGLSVPAADAEILVPIGQLKQDAALNRSRKDAREFEESLKRAIALNRKQTEDEVDRLTEQALDEWAEVSEPILNPILELVESAQSFEEFADKLPQLAEALDADTFTQQLTQLCWQARANGDVTDG